MTMSPRIEVHESSAALATAVAGELLTRLADVQAAGHEPHVGLTGGTVAEAVHHELGRLSASSEVDWTRVVFWWGDERFVEPASDERNERLAREAFLDLVDVDPAKVPTPIASCSRISAAEPAPIPEIKIMTLSGTAPMTRQRSEGRH